MKKVLKIIAILFVVATIVSAAGCAGKTTTANRTQGASEQVTSAAANNASKNADGNNTSTVINATPAQKIELITGNTTTQTSNHISNVQRKQTIAKSHQQVSSTQNVSMNISK